MVICEERFNISYTCNYNGKTWQGEKMLYAYPNAIEELALGHIVLDCLPLYDKDFSYEIRQNGSNYTVNLEAKDKATKENAPISIHATEINEVMQKILSSQGKWESSGCFHCATLYHPITKELIIAEDIGRHNCVDRLKGHCIKHNLAMEEHFLFITARITASIYKKMRRAGIATIISKSAITSTSLQGAKDEDCTLIAFCRQDNKEGNARFTLYNKGCNFTIIND